MTWRDRAACFGHDPIAWDLETEAGRYVCRNLCPVRMECLIDALRPKPEGGVRDEGGIRGGHTEDERRAMIRRGGTNRARARALAGVVS